MTTVLEPFSDAALPTSDTPTSADAPVAPPSPSPDPGAHGSGRPWWSWPARIGVALSALVLYTWDLSRVGMGNEFYAAAVKSGTESWKAFLFGSLDPGSFITVDKPPASLWLMELSGRVFGFSSLSMLIPEALCGVASVLVLYHLVRRWMGEGAAVLASLAFLITPVSVLMFRYNNPDALLTLLLLLAAWALWSAIERAATYKLVLCGALIGLAFTTKMLQAFLVVPAFGLVYLWSGTPRLRRRVVQLLWGGLALLVSSSWWVALVELWPAASRPYVGGSTNNSELNLIFGYNGFARVLGNSGPGGGSGGAGGGIGFAGSAGVLRLFNDILGGQVAWFLPLAILGLAGGLWWIVRAPRTDRVRAGFVLWGGWMLVTAAVFSEMKGIFHPYYTVALAPAVAALAGGGAVGLWRLSRREHRFAWCWSVLLAAGVVVSAVWAAMLLDRTPGYDRGLAAAVMVVGILAGVVLLALGVVPALREASPRVRRGLAAGAALGAVAALAAGPTAYAVTTIGSTPSGGDPTAGPAATSGFGAPGGGGAPFAGGFPGASGGAAVRGGGGAGGSGGGQSAVSTSTTRYLEAHRGSAEYLVAVDGSQAADGIILATGDPVMAMGGFTGSDPYPTVAQFKKLVAEGKVHYVLTGGGGLAGGGGLPGGGVFPGGGGASSGELGGPPGGFGEAFFGGPPTGATGLQGSGGFRPGGAGFGAAAGPGGGSGTVSAVMSWVESHGTKVTGVSGSGGTLYYVSSKAATS